MGKLPVPFWILGFLAALSPLDAFSEGSCTWEEARAILEQSPELLAHVEGTLDVDSIGFALRLGSHYTDLSGQRVAPFTFRARSKASPVVALDLVLEAELTFFDHAGKPVASGDAPRAHQVRQVLTGIRLLPVATPAASEPASQAMSERTVWIQEQEASLQKATLSATIIPFPPGNSSLSGEVRFLRDPATQATRAITVRGSLSPDGKSRFEEHYAFAGAELFLLRRRESSWLVHPENPESSILRAVETTYHFLEGSIYQALERRAQALREEDLDRALQAAPQQQIALSGAESMQFLARASRLSLVRDSAGLPAIYLPDP